MPINIAQARPGMCLLVDGELLPLGQILEREIAAAH